MKVTAVFSDGAEKDVTHLALFKPLEAKVASVTAGGRIKAEGTGQAAIVATYRRQSGIARVLVPQRLTQPFPELPPNNKIDELVFAQLKKLGMPPSEVCSDEVFLRRVYLDVIGTLPAADEVRGFLADKAPEKRSKLIDRLLEREEFADFWALKWGDLLRIKSEFPVRLWPKAVQTYYRWVREASGREQALRPVRPRAADGQRQQFPLRPSTSCRANPGARTRRPSPRARRLVFMGVRLGCARCHGHPTENWTLDDNLGLAAFFAKVAFKTTQEWKEEIVYFNRKAAFRHPQTKEIVKPKFLGGEALEVPERDDPREQVRRLAHLAGEPWFARNIVNRIWFWLLGRGIVHEPDDLRPTNPPENPELLAYLAQDLVGPQVRPEAHLPPDPELEDLPAFQPDRTSGTRTTRTTSRTTTCKRLGAEAAPGRHRAGHRDLRAVRQPRSPSRTRGCRRATGPCSLPTATSSAPFLELFGRPPRDTPYECERNLHTSLRQALYFLNSDHLQNRSQQQPAPQAAGSRRTRPTRRSSTSCTWLSLCRPPTAEEKAEDPGIPRPGQESARPGRPGPGLGRVQYQGVHVQSLTKEGSVMLDVQE